MILRKFLELRGWSVADLADEMRSTNEKIGRQTIHAWLNGRSIPRKKALARIVEITDGAVTYEDFAR